MNTRCYRCGWSFSMSREALEEAAASGAGQKAYVIHCPRCRQAIRIPMDQIIRALPTGWTPATREQPARAGGAAAEGMAEPQPAGEAEAAPEIAAPDRPQRRHRHSSKTHSGDSAAISAAKKSTHPN